MNKTLKGILMEAACIAFFAIVASVYFPKAFKGWRLTGEDNSANDGLRVELNNYRAEHNGETPRWINSIFSGMPTYQIAPSYDSAKPMSLVEKIYHLGLPDYVWYVFASMLGFYILLRAFDFRRWMAVLGAVVWAFSSYFFIIIAAGHLWKAITLAYIPPTIAGVVMCFKGRYLWGFVVTALFATLQINGNHPQMTYYFLIPELLMFGAFVVRCILKKETGKLIKATCAIFAAAVIAIGLNASNLYHTYKYSDQTMRGKSELKKAGKEGDQTDSGLERSYITNWSYGIDETLTLLIPNLKGGASVPLARNATAMKHADSQLTSAGIYEQIGQYWGEQPGTSGPVYVGALICMLFVLALFVIPNRNAMKWVLLASTLLSFLLSWGHNLQWFTDLFIDHVPFYSKFRTVSSILVVAEFTIPLLAMLGLKRFIENMGDSNLRPKMLRSLYWSTGITAGICLLFAVWPTFFGNCVSSAEEEGIRSSLDPTSANMILSSIATMRASMLTSDAWRSLLIVMLGAALLFFYYRTAMSNKGKVAWSTQAAIGGLIIAVCLIDMWQVNKRYMNDSLFKEPAIQGERSKTPAEEHILATSGDKRDYRVLNTTVSTFNDNTTSFFFNSIGGYHPAKLRRYQELIEAYMSSSNSTVHDELNSALQMYSQERLDTAAMVASGNLQFPIYNLSDMDADTICPVLNMLNTRWIILGNSQSEMPLENTHAYGHAWFVDDMKVVSTANEELETLKDVSPRHTAVVDKSFSSILGKAAPADSSDYIRLTGQTSTTCTYEADSKKGGIAVFSEIYYPEWEATIDGKPADIARADYVLRAMSIPAGKHTIEMSFNPQSINKTETIAYICLALLLAALLLASFLTWRQRTSAQ